MECTRLVCIRLDFVSFIEDIPPVYEFRRALAWLVVETVVESDESRDCKRNDEEMTIMDLLLKIDIS